MRVHIPINLRFTAPHTGDFTSFVEILRALAQVRGENEYVVTFNADPEAFPVKPGGPLSYRVLLPSGWMRRFRYEPWLQLLYPRSVRRHDRAQGRSRSAGLFLDAKMPLAWRGPSVVRMQDLAFHYFPECFKRKDLLRLRAEAALAVKRADRLVAISEATRVDLIRLYGADPKRIAVAPNAVGPAFRPMEDRDAVRTQLSRLGLSRPFVLTVGVLQRRKNLLRLIQAWEQLRTGADPGCDLVIAGGRGWLYEEVLAFHAQMRFANEVRFLGPVSEGDLVALYNQAHLFILPSLYEGFGIPLAEAMACGAPCLAARSSSLPEVGGDAAVYFDPTSVEEISGALRRALSDDGLRRSLSARGPAQAAKFSWEGTARILDQVLREAARG